MEFRVRARTHKQFWSIDSNFTNNGFFSLTLTQLMQPSQELQFQKFSIIPNYKFFQKFWTTEPHLAGTQLETITKIVHTHHTAESVTQRHCQCPDQTN